MEKITGWGNYPVEYSDILNPKTEEEIKNLLKKGIENVIPRGLGRSYGDTSNNHEGQVLKLNHFQNIKMDELGLLECDAGVSLEEILAYSLPKGYFLPVTPGTKFVTMGGAIANDVHGKNHHVDGSISNHVVSFRLMIASGEILTCSREQNKELFWATVGGIGTTGVVLDAKIKMTPVESAYISAKYEQAKNIHEAIDKFTEGDENYQFSVAWIDCMSTGDKVGRSVLMRGNHATTNQLSNKLQRNPLYVKEKLKLTIPFYLPTGLLNNTTVKMFNSLYYGINKDSEKIIDYDTFFYPLDAIHHWNRGYGKKGFLQYQMVFPFENGKEGLLEILKTLHDDHHTSFLAVLKTFGKESNGYLSFPMEGYTLALDLPIRGEKTFAACEELDKIVLKYGGRTYLAKDARMSKDTFYKMYGDKIEAQLKVKKEVDPLGIFSSSMSRRIGL